MQHLPPQILHVCYLLSSILFHLVPIFFSFIHFLWQQLCVDFYVPTCNTDRISLASLPRHLGPLMSFLH